MQKTVGIHKKHVSDLDKSLYGYFFQVEIKDTNYNIGNIVWYDSRTKKILFTWKESQENRNKVGDTIVTNQVTRKVKFTNIKGDFIFKYDYHNKKIINEYFNQQVDLQYFSEDDRVYILFVDMANKSVYFMGRFVTDDGYLYHQYILNNSYTFNKGVRRVNNKQRKLHEKLLKQQSIYNNCFDTLYYFDMDINKLETIEKKIHKLITQIKKSNERMFNSKYYNELNIYDNLLDLNDSVYCGADTNVEL